jgi:anaerobic selenocysteine-containing dehydrogenase
VSAGRGARAAATNRQAVDSSLSGERLQPEPTFVVSTRRGKQFNSMVQRERDPLTGAARGDVLISREDLHRLRIAAGTAVRLRSADGVFEGRLREAPIRSGNLEVHWPEGNGLLSGTRIDADSLEPDYNAVVTLEPLNEA